MSPYKTPEKCNGRCPLCEKREDCIHDMPYPEDEDDFTDSYFDDREFWEKELDGEYFDDRERAWIDDKEKCDLGNER